MKHFRTAMFLLLLASPGLFAQSAAVSQISGNVLDASGSAIAGAQVTATQTDTGLTRSTQSATDGAYVLPSLPIGPYRLEVQKDGFSTYVQSGIVLQVNTNPAISAILAVGAVTEHISVEAAAAMVETQSTGVGQVIDQARVVELPLNGRSVTQLIGLAGGAAYTPASGNLTSTKNYQNGEAVVSVAGGALNGLTYLLDGATHNDVFNNLNLPLPFPDALQEFKVETSALPAQYGYHSAGAVNIVTKSGANQFHGDAFEFVRNNSFNAKGYFDAQRDTLKRNQFGGTFGGPIKKNKLFFFAGYQGTTVRSAPSSAFAFLPTPAMLNGDFRAVTGPGCNASGQITLKAPFSGNQISPTLFSAPAVKMLSFFAPLPTNDCGKVTYGVKSNFNEYMGVAKVDYQLSTNHSMFGRYYATHYFAPSSFSGNQITMASPYIDNLIQSAVWGDTIVFGPNTINSFHATMNRTAVVKNAPPFFDPVDLGIPWTVLLPDYTRINALPAFQSSCNVCALGAIFTTTYQLGDDFSMVRGSHQMGFGANWISPVHHSLLNGSSGGTFNFNGSVTGLVQADYLIGALSSFQQGNTQFDSARHQYLGMYAQDSWRVNSRLKVNYGVRWEPFFGGKSQYGQFTHFDKARFDQNLHSSVYPNAPAGMLFIGDKELDSTGGRPHNIDWNNFAPRVGMVLDPKGDGKMTIRASWGMFYDLPHTLFFDDFSREAPWGQNITVLNPPQGFSNPWGGFPGGNPFPPALNQNYQFRPGLYWQTVPLNLKTTYVEQWNLSVQRQFGANWLATASYLGNNTIHLWTDRELNPAVYIPGTCPAGVFGLTAAGACSTTANTDSRRALTLQNPSQGQFIGTLQSLDDGGTANYSGLLLSLQHRFANHFTVLGNYTWSHCITDLYTTELSGPSYVNPNNRRFDRGNCPYTDVRQIANISVVAQSPKFGNRVTQAVAGNWQVSGIVSYNSGSYFGVTTGLDNALIGVNTTAAISYQRPNQVLTDPYCANKSKDCWVNPKAFNNGGAAGTFGNLGPNNPGYLAPGTFGNLGNTSLLGPAYFNLDMALSRMFSVTERHRIEIRAEAFNLQNRVNFQNPATTTYPNGPTAAMTNPTFGKITTAYPARVMQFAVKYVF